MGPSGRFTHVGIILDCLGQVNAGFIQVLYLGRAPHTKETLPDFLKWHRVTRHPLVFRRLTSSQRTPGFWSVTVLASLILPTKLRVLTPPWIISFRVWRIEGLPLVIKSIILLYLDCSLDLRKVKVVNG